jgi:hypothetical protein
MRCIFAKGKQRELLLLARISLGLPWRELAQKLDVGYSTLRDWRDEKWSMKQSTFVKLIELCPQCRPFATSVIELKDDNWGRKLGGLSTRSRQHGFLNPKYEKQSSFWKSSGGRIGTRKWHATMKKEKPSEYHQLQYNRIKQSLKYKHEYQGQKYRNLLELQVAKILSEKGFDFDYERLVDCDGKFFFPDFVLQDIIIECTFWDDVDQRARELKKKIDSYLKLPFKLVLIVTIPKYLDKYKELLTDSDVMVITQDNLSELLDGKFGRVKRAT